MSMARNLPADPLACGFGVGPYPSSQGAPYGSKHLSVRSDVSIDNLRSVLLSGRMFHCGRTAARDAGARCWWTEGAVSGVGWFSSSQDATSPLFPVDSVLLNSLIDTNSIRGMSATTALLL